MLKVAFSVKMSPYEQINIVAANPLRKWRLNLNTNNSLYMLSLAQTFFHMNVRLGMCEYCCSNLGTCTI